jgi:hypothetical protein
LKAQPGERTGGTLGPNSVSWISMVARCHQANAFGKPPAADGCVVGDGTWSGNADARKSPRANPFRQLVDCRPFLTAPVDAFDRGLNATRLVIAGHPLCLPRRHRSRHPDAHARQSCRRRPSSPQLEWTPKRRKATGRCPRRSTASLRRGCSTVCTAHDYVCRTYMATMRQVVRLGVQD